MIEKGDHRIEGGAMAMRSLLKLPQRPTAVITSNDLTAIGALGAILHAGLKVPEDISLIGFDDISFAHLTQPPLTTVILSRTQLAVTAFAALEALIRKEDGPACRLLDSHPPGDAEVRPAPSRRATALSKDRWRHPALRARGGEEH